MLEPEEFYRFPVVKVDPNAKRGKGSRKGKSGSLTGHYVDRPERWNRLDVGQRKVVHIARPNQGEKHAPAQELRGPAFAVMAVKPEPGASSCAWCYLVNAENFLAPNAWTAEEWDAPGAPDLPAAPHAEDTQAEVLLALPRGIVVRFTVSNLDRLDAVLADPTSELDPASVTANGVTYDVEPVRLNNESEIWGQLRNGCIAGRVLHHQTERVVPIVNVTSLMGPVEHKGKKKR